MTSGDARFAYVNLILQNSGGITGKLEDQAEAARVVAPEMDVIWMTRGAASETRASGLLVRDMGPGSRLQCRIRQMKELNRMQREYEAILLRYPLCDPITHFGLRRPFNIGSEHHTKEVPELRANRDPRVITERLLGPKFLSRFGGFFAVTDEILAYEQARASKSRPGFVAYNGISTTRIPSEYRQGKLFSSWPNIRFVASSPAFSFWQGLDVVLAGFALQDHGCELHVCGEVDADTRARGKGLTGIVFHGRLERKQLMEVYGKCDIGVASFGLQRKGLAQGTTLKVREYLACGLPVVLGHEDPAFPVNFPYTLQLSAFDFSRIRSWCASLAAFSREEVFRAAEPYISMRQLISKQIAGLQKIAVAQRVQ